MFQAIITFCNITQFELKKANEALLYKYGVEASLAFCGCAAILSVFILNCNCLPSCLLSNVRLYNVQEFFTF
jgi:hypothetical protein